MTVNRRTQVDRSAATRTALVDAARPLFAEHGYGGVGTETIVRAAGVTRGALYHQFTDKTELFAAVFEAVEEDIGARIGEVVAAAETTDPLEAMRTGAGAWLDACAEPEVQQIVLLDAPAVLGWERWREIGMRHGMGLVEGVLGHAMEVGRVRRQPLRPLAHVVVGALDEAALYVARAEDPVTAGREARDVVDQLIAGFAAGD
ncbi:MAG TPA: TetR/AcrR family transcriptional regulator [Thermoleophilaceae bacterium]|nr:TetR/AcrR family transcriptional regulator [Thermoleophilaceae bacterium]